VLINKHSLLCMSNHTQWSVLIYQGEVVISMLEAFFAMFYAIVTGFLELVTSVFNSFADYMYASADATLMVRIGVGMLVFALAMVATMPLRSR